MPRLPIISSRDFIKYLTKKKGFVYTNTKGSHHFYQKGNLRISVPERREIHQELLHDILCEIGIEREDFIREWNS